MLSFHLTQLLTGHGVFFTYLKRIKTADSDRCPHFDKDLQDSMEHTLTQCEAWTEQRIRLVTTLNINIDELTLSRMVAKMIESKEKWTAVYTFAESVMFQKEEHERRNRSTCQTKIQAQFRRKEATKVTAHSGRNREIAVKNLPNL